MTERDRIIAAANEAIAAAPDASARQVLSTLLTTLLTKAGLYKGFNYAYWLDTGHAAWIAAGKPDDNRSFIGDQSQVRFY